MKLPHISLTAGQNTPPLPPPPFYESTVNVSAPPVQDLVIGPQSLGLAGHPTTHWGVHVSMYVFFPKVK